MICVRHSFHSFANLLLLLLLLLLLSFKAAILAAVLGGVGLVLIANSIIRPIPLHSFDIKYTIFALPTNVCEHNIHNEANASFDPDVDCDPMEAILHNGWITFSDVNCVAASLLSLLPLLLV